MPYKDPQRLREYLRNWRREQKLRTLTQHSSVSFYQSDQSYLDNTSTGAASLLNPSPVSFYQMTSGQPHRVRFSYQPAQQITTSAVDQRAVKISPDGASQTRRSAVQAYQLSRGQLSALRATSKSAGIRRPSALLPGNASRHLAVPIASLLVEVLSRWL
jgi:hypothetical protein